MPSITHVLTDDDRALATVNARKARTKRMNLKSDLKSGRITLNEFMCHPDAERIKVKDMLKSMPGIGESKASRIMLAIDIDGSRRVKGLGCRQRAAILEHFEKPDCLE